MDTYIFYKTICNVNQKFYFGVHKVVGSIDSDPYLGSGVDLQKDIEKYGRDKFTRYVIMETIDKELTDLAERHYVRQDEIDNPDCYNKKLGGDDHNHQSNESIKKKLEQEKFLKSFNKIRNAVGKTENPIEYNKTEAESVIVYKSRKKQNSKVDGTWLALKSNKITENEKQLKYYSSLLNSQRTVIKNLNKDWDAIDKRYEEALNQLDEYETEVKRYTVLVDKEKALN